MTTNQKSIIELLFKGCFVAAHNNRYRVLNANRHPEIAFTTKTAKKILPLLRKKKDGSMVIDLRQVRSMNGNTWVKQHYKETKQ